MMNEEQSRIYGIIERANLKEDYNSQSGHCLTIAVALQEVFGGEVTALTETPEEGFNHVFIVKEDDSIYDGWGLRDFSDVFDMHIPKEVRRVEPSMHLYALEEPEEQFPGAYDEKLKNEIVNRLNKVIEDDEDFR